MKKAFAVALWLLVCIYIFVGVKLMGAWMVNNGGTIGFLVFPMLVLLICFGVFMISIKIGKYVLKQPGKE